MTQPALAQQTTYGRMYSREEGGIAEVPSITTIISQSSDTLHGWHAHMAAQAVVKDDRLKTAKASTLRVIAKDAVGAADKYRDKAAERGDRVHFYCEQYSREKMGLENELEEALVELQKQGEQGFAQQFDWWFESYKVEPLFTEVTIWNSTLGYAGTLDLLARIGGRLCIVDFKTKSVDYSGRVKALSTDVVMQLAAGAKAEEYFDEEEKTWKQWPFEEEPLLLALALANSDHMTVAVERDALPAYWKKFCTLKRMWDVNEEVGHVLKPLKPIPAPGV
ncbi:MAG: cytochrome [Micrococcaceae bacterium]